MRPVKKYLMRLDLKNEALSEEDRSRRFAQYLLKIGRKISEILKSYNDPEKVKEWRSNLWIFVSVFTDQNAKQLYKIYRQAIKDIELAGHRHQATKDAKKENDKMERKSILDTSPKKESEKNSKHRFQQDRPNKRPHEDDGGKHKGDRPIKKKFADQPDRKPDRRESFGDKNVPQKSPNSYSNHPHHGYSNHRENMQKSKGERWNSSAHPGNWQKDRYSGDFKNRDHYRNYNRDDAGSFQRGKPHRNDFPYSQDRHNNRYGGGSYGYGMRPPPYGMPTQPPPAHSGYSYGPPPLHSPSSLGQPPPPGMSDHSSDSYGPYQGHADSWRRRSNDRHDKHNSSDYKSKN